MKSDQMGTGHNNPSPRELPLSNQARFKLLPARVSQRRDLQLPAAQAGAAAVATQESPQTRPQQPTRLDPLLTRETPQPPQPEGGPPRPAQDPAPAPCASACPDAGSRPERPHNRAEMMGRTGPGSRPAPPTSRPPSSRSASRALSRDRVLRGRSRTDRRTHAH